jgi:tripeptide aminopeptidase
MRIDENKLLSRFLSYVHENTMADETSASSPSSACQLVFAEKLASELRELGLSEVMLSPQGVVTATLPATKGFEHLPTIGFIAHMDTIPEFSGENVQPRIIKNYDGGDIILHAEKGIVTRVEEFPALSALVGQTLIVTDGTTVLGADDKAGMAAILSAAEYLLAHPEIPHGRLRLGFTPDEEIGRGTENFNVEDFDAAWAYTVDGGGLGELSYETFNAASAVVEIQGKSVHPGSAKDIMINAALLAMEFQSLLPADEVPEKTEGYEGFNHLTQLTASVEKAALSYILRDFEQTGLEHRKDLMRKAAETINQRYGKELVRVCLKDSYPNLKNGIQDMMIVDRAAQAIRRVTGKEARVLPVRGGTDGSMLSAKGLPTPNFFTGGYFAHGPHELCVLEHMRQAAETVLEIAVSFAKEGDRKWRNS